MAHHLNYNEKLNRHSFFSVQQKAWHGLGTIIESLPNSKEALRFAGLDYVVEKRPLFTYDEENFLADPDVELKIPEIEVPNYFATVRVDTDQVLGVVGKDYTVVQNVDAFNFFDAIVGGGEGIQFETAGALGLGERLFITAKLPDYIKVGRDDLIEQYLFLTTSHDGFGSITAAFTPVRIVCFNTLNAALKSCSNAVKIRHTASAKERLEQAHQLMGITRSLSVDLEQLFNRWAGVRISDPEIKKLIQLAMVPGKEVLQNILAGKEDELSASFKNICEAAVSYAFDNPTQQMETTQGTLFGAYNAITGYFQNVKAFKNEETKLKSILFGGVAQQRAQRAFDLCTEFMKHGATALHLN